MVPSKILIILLSGQFESWKYFIKKIAKGYSPSMERQKMKDIQTLTFKLWETPSCVTVRFSWEVVWFVWMSPKATYSHGGQASRISDWFMIQH